MESVVCSKKLEEMIAICSSSSGHNQGFGCWRRKGQCSLRKYHWSLLRKRCELEAHNIDCAVFDQTAKKEVWALGTGVCKKNGHSALAK